MITFLFIWFGAGLRYPITNNFGGIDLRVMSFRDFESSKRVE